MPSSTFSLASDKCFYTNQSVNNRVCLVAGEVRSRLLVERANFAVHVMVSGWKGTDAFHRRLIIINCQRWWESIMNHDLQENTPCLPTWCCAAVYSSSSSSSFFSSVIYDDEVDDISCLRVVLSLQLATASLGLNCKFLDVFHPLFCLSSLASFSSNMAIESSRW